MDKKDKQILKDSLDVVVSAIPGLNVAWGVKQGIVWGWFKTAPAKSTGMG